MPASERGGLRTLGQHVARASASLTHSLTRPMLLVQGCHFENHRSVVSVFGFPAFIPVALCVREHGSLQWTRLCRILKFGGFHLTKYPRHHPHATDYDRPQSAVWPAVLVAPGDGTCCGEPEGAHRTVQSCGSPETRTTLWVTCASIKIRLKKESRETSHGTEPTRWEEPTGGGLRRPRPSPGAECPEERPPSSPAGPGHLRSPGRLPEASAPCTAARVHGPCGHGSAVGDAPAAGPPTRPAVERDPPRTSAFLLFSKLEDSRRQCSAPSDFTSREAWGSASAPAPPTRWPAACSLLAPAAPASARVQVTAAPRWEGPCPHGPERRFHLQGGSSGGA